MDFLFPIAIVAFVLFYWRSAYIVCKREIPLNSIGDFLVKNWQCNRIIWGILFGRAKYKNVPRDFHFYWIKYVGLCYLLFFASMFIFVFFYTLFG